jgi:conjugative relaxase-like TrwC/TraI family protein
VLSVASGYSPDYLLKEVATGRESYYTGAVTDGEPPGRWWGRGAENLGLTGLVDAQDMRAVYERFLDPRADGFRDPARWDELGQTSTLGHSGRRYPTEDQLYAAALEREPDASAERRAELRVEAGKSARHNVAFLDVTFSVQKSVTVLHTAFEAEEVAARKAGDEEAVAAWGEYRQAVEDAIWSGNNAALEYLAEHAGYARVGHHGGAAGRYVDAHDWIVTSFFQHDSRDHDPQLHIHNPVLNRVEGADGEWRTLDGRSLYRFRPAAAAVAERTTDERLGTTLGVRLAMRPDGKAREVLGVDEATTDLFSSRRRAVTGKAAELIAEFEARQGREANGLERDRLSRQATMITRQAKSHDGETRAQFLDRVDTKLRAEVESGLHGLAQTALAARTGSRSPEEWTPGAVLETALADVQSKKAGWTRADLTRAINDALPDTLGLADGRDVAALLDQLTEQGLALATPLDTARPAAADLPTDLRLADGRSAYEASGAALFATPTHVHTERAMLASVRRHDRRPALPRYAVDGFLSDLRDICVELGDDQAAAVRGVLTSGSRVETLVGPAGTGKSFVVGAIARAWTHPELRGAADSRVFGLATSQIATEVLAGEGLTTRNVARWLATQDRLTPGNSHDDDRGWRLGPQDLVVVDESAMTDTAALTKIHEHVENAGAKLLLVGDHRQLAAVGAGGAMDLVAQSGARYELADTRRFTASWEGPASLRLRDGDETVLRDYHREGRILDCGTLDDAEASATRAWLADTLAGHRSVLVVDTNDQAAKLAATLRAELVRLGRVTEDGVELGRDGTMAGVGDVVAARRNGWELLGHAGNAKAPINRETYRVVDASEDGSLTVVPENSTSKEHRIALPSDYVDRDVSLAYVGTVHSAQGLTVDTSHLVATPSSSRAATYVGLTRGREKNTVHTATISAPDDPARGLATDHSLHRDPVAVLAGVVTREDSPDDESALAIATRSAEEAGSARTAGELFADAAALAAVERTGRWLDELAADGTISAHDRQRLAAEDGSASLSRVLRRAELAGNDPESVLRDAVTDRPLDGARNLTNVIHARVRDAHDYDPAGRKWTEWVPTTGRNEWDRYLTGLAEAADERAAELAEQLAEEPPAWITEALGPVPKARAERELWLDQAAAVAGWRELSDHDDADDALGAAPAPGQVEAYASFRAAWRALGRPEIDREELELSDGQLRVRVRAHEREAAWAPRYVGNELAGTRQATDRAEQDVALRRAEADAMPDQEDRAQALNQVDEAQALAATLRERADELVELDDARSQWLAHTSGTRAAADRAKAELAARHADDVEPEPAVTAAEWLAAHRAAVDQDEKDRAITDDDVSDRPEELSLETVEEESVAWSEPETVDRDVRDVAAEEPSAVGEDDVRVPTANETSAAIERANRALAEINARNELDAQEDLDHRAEQLTEWKARDAEVETNEPTTDVDDYIDNGLGQRAE